MPGSTIDLYSFQDTTTKEENIYILIQKLLLTLPLKAFIVERYLISNFLYQPLFFKRALIPAIFLQ